MSMELEKKEFYQKFTGVGFSNNEDTGEGYYFIPQVDKIWQWFKLQLEEESREAELKGVGKILDSLWTASIPLLGEKASKRIKKEMVYYFGKNWAVVMYKFIGQKGNRHKPVKTLDQITLKNSKEKG